MTATTAAVVDLRASGVEAAKEADVYRGRPGHGTRYLIRRSGLSED